MYTWTITEIRENDKYLDITLKDKGHKSTISIKANDKPFLLTFFKSKNLVKIIGQNFISRSDNPYTAIEILIIEAKTGKRYHKPSDKKIFDTITTDLANMKEPDLSLFDSLTIAQSISRIWTERDPQHKLGKPSKDWLEEINQDIKTKSDGIVSIASTKTPKKYLPGILGPVYFADLVTIYGRRITILIGPYDKPIEFLKKHKEPLQK